MSGDRLYLKPNVRVEGLVNRFVAWLHIFAPAQAAMNLANVQLPMLDSYLAHPETHRAAVADPRMRGGLFVNVAVERAGEIQALRDEIARECAPELELAAALKQTETLVRQNAAGYAMTPLYPQVHPLLRGYAELVYDLGNRPSLRLLEPLLYRSPHYRADRQSIQLSLDDGSEPPFILSTPRLARPDALHLPLPLRHPGIDDFFRLRDRPEPFSKIADALEVTGPADEALLAGLLTPGPAIPADREVAAGGRIRYLGHACLLLQSETTSIIVDPFISSHHAAGDRFTYADLPEHIDYCLITHGHQDHVVLETLLQLRGKVGTVVVPRSGGGQLQDPSLRLALSRLGFAVTEVDDFDQLAFPGGRIVATPFLGEHCDLDIRAKTTYWVSIAGRGVFIGADTSGVQPELYDHIRGAVGPTDVAFIGMECDGAPLNWLYGGLFTQPVPRKMSLTRKMSGSDAAQASEIVDRLGASEAYIYAMGEEDWLQHVMATSYSPDSYQLQQVAEFLGRCRDRGVAAEHLLVRKELRW
jgi:L-ascorbate metabolism protein UlaG (beta-lactamase superfamily)